MDKLYFDIETVPTQRQDLKDLIAETIKCPGNIKKPESILKWEREDKPAAIEKAILSTSLDGAFGEIISIAWAINDDPINGIIRKLDQTETALLLKFNQIVNDAKSFEGTLQFAGHNIVNFDLRFIWQRMLIKQVPIPLELRAAIEARPNDWTKNFDTMLFWGGAYSKDWASVEKLCTVFNVENPKQVGLDGSKVWEYIQAGKYDEVLAYNKWDVEAERSLAKIMMNSL